MTNVSKLVVLKNLSKYYDYTIEVHYKDAGYEEILIDKGADLTVLRDTLSNIGINIDELEDGRYAYQTDINPDLVYTPEMIKTYGIDVV